MKKRHSDIKFKQFSLTTILASLIKYAQKHGLNYKSWFIGSNLDLNQIQKTYNVIDFEKMCFIIKNALNDSQDSNLGLKVGMDAGLVSMGILGFAMQSCETVAEAIEIALRYHRTAGSVLNFNFFVINDICELEVTDFIEDSELKKFFYDEFFSSIISSLNTIFGDHNDVIDLQLTYLSKSNIREYNNLFECPVQFNKIKNKMRFNLTMLARPLKLHSQVNRVTAVQICENTLAQFEKLTTPTYRY